MSKRKKGETGFSTNGKGQFVDPFTGEVLVPVKQLQDAARQIPERMSDEEADLILQERIRRGDVRLADAARETGIDRQFLSHAISKIKPDEHYLPDGSLPTGKPDEKTVLGSELIFKHPIPARGTCISKGLLEGIKEEFDKYNSSKKIAGYWSSKELSNKLGGKQKGAYLMRTFKHALETGATQINYDGLAIPRDAFIQYGNREESTYAISEHWGQKIVDAHNSITEKPAHMLGFAVFCKEAGMSPQSPRGLQARAIFEEAEKQFNDSNRKEKPVRVKDTEVDCGYFRNESGGKVFCLDRSLIERFGLEVPDKPEDMLSFSVFLKAVPTNSTSPKGQKVRTFFEAAEKQFDDPLRNGKPIVVDGIKIDCGQFKDGHSVNFCLSRSMIAKLGFSELSPKPETMLAFSFFLQKAGISHEMAKGRAVKAIFEEAKRQYDDPARGDKPVLIDGVEIACGRFKNNTLEVFCLDDSMIERLNLRLPDKPKTMLALTTFIKEAGMSPSKPKSYAKVAEIFKESERQFDDADRKDKPVVIDGTEIKCGRFRGIKGGDVFCLDQSMIERLGLVFPPKPDHMLSFTKFYEKAGTMPANPRGKKVKAIFEECEKQFDDPERKDRPVVYNGLGVDCGRYQSSTWKGFCISETMIDRLGLVLPERPAHMVSSYEFCMETGIRLGKRVDRLNAIFEEAERQYDDPTRGDRPIIIEGREVECGRFQRGASDAFCLSRSAIDQFKIILPDKPAGMLNFSEFAKKAGSAVDSPRGNEIRAIFEEAERQFIDSARGDKPVHINGIDIDCGRFKPNKGMDVFCLNSSMIERLKDLLRPRKLDPYTGEQFFPIKELQAATEHIPKKHIQKTSPAEKIGGANETALPDSVRAELEEKRSPERSK